MSALPASNEEVSCWICLDAGPDDTGGGLVRNCSCRGSAGFAHLQCLVKYAEQKMHDLRGQDCSKVEDPWRTCPNCHQYYQSDLGVDLASALVSLIEENRLSDQKSLVEALNTKVEAYGRMGSVSLLSPKQKADIQQTAYKSISLMNKNNLRSERMRGVEASMLFALGELADKGVDGHARMALAFYEKSLQLYKDTGNSIGCSALEARIADTKRKYEKGGELSPGEKLKQQRIIHKKTAEVYGGTQTSLKNDLALAVRLKRAHHGIQAERLLMELAPKSLQVHGRDHPLTKTIETNLHSFRERIVMLVTPAGRTVVQALRWDESGRKCVVRGPIAAPRSIEQEKTFTVPTGNLWARKGTPVVCHGLVKAAHLNGKIGDVRNLNVETLRQEVHFEDTSLKPCIAHIKSENLQILIDLPPKQG